MKYDPQKHHRRSIRLKGSDYTQPGAYFVTMCVYQRDEIFGEVINGEMKLSALGEIVHQEWLRSAGIRKEIRLFEDEFVVMPNHAHGIVWIVDTSVVGRTASAQPTMPALIWGVCHTPRLVRLVRPCDGRRVPWDHSSQALRRRSRHGRNMN